MVYRYRPSQRKVTKKIGKVAKFINPKKIESEQQKKVFIVTVSIALIFITYFIVSSATSYILYTNDIEAELDKTKTTLYSTTSDLNICKNNLDNSAEDLKVCNADLSGTSSELTTCTDLRVKYKDERDKWESDYSNCNDARTKCEDELDSITANYTELKATLANITANATAVEASYRNYVCCLTKFTNPSATVVYWKLENNRMLCQVQSAAGYTGMDVSELDC